MGAKAITGADIAEAIRHAAAARGHKIKPHFCDKPDCTGCKMLEEVNGAKLEFHRPTRERARTPGDDDE